MKRTIRAAGAATLLLAAHMINFAPQVSAGEINFNLPQAVEYALQNNGDLKALREEKGVREAGKIKAGLYPNPVLEADGTTGELTGSRFENTVSIGLTQEIVTAGKRGKRVEMAERELEGFERQIDNARRLLAEEVKTAFFELLLADGRMKLAERSAVLNRQLMDIAGLRFDAGDIPELEVNLARVEMARSEGRKAEAERELYPVKARLMALMGIPSAESAEFGGPMEGKPFGKGLDELRTLALANRPDLKAWEVETARGDAEIALARAERIPNVTVGLGYQRENSAIDVSGEEIKTRDNLIALKLSVPLPLFDRNQAGVREALARKGSAENRYQSARLTIAREVEAAFARLSAAEKSLTIYARDIIPQLEENLKLVQEAYRLGEVGILTVIEEQKKFFEVNDGYLAALYNRQTALARLEAALGTELE